MTSNPIRKSVVLRCIRGCLETADNWVAKRNRTAADMWWNKSDAGQANPSRASGVGRRMERRSTRKNEVAGAVIRTARGPASERKGSRIKWRTLAAGALVSAIVAVMASSGASAEDRIVGDPGGEVVSYVHKYQQIRVSGERVVIDGPCLSACTLLTGIIPRDRICVTPRAVLGFHAASYYDDVSRKLVPTRAGSRLVMSYYPPQIRGWIERHGGLTPHLIHLRGRKLAALYHTCR